MTFWSALLLGLLASAHCAGMCGGLQSVFQQSFVIRSKRQASIHLVVLNLGRLSMYVVFGFVFTYFGTKILSVIDIPELTNGARYIAAFVLIAMGIQLVLSNAKPFQFLEIIGGWLWRLVSRYHPNEGGDSIARSYRLGMIWAFLPCGLIYGVLLTTLLSNDPMQGASTMFGFGLGTLPAMVLTGSVYRHFRGLVRARYTQLFGGAIFVQGGVLILLAPLFVDMGFMRAYPELVSTMFCVS
jgi:sulfite exporter TauE/SafE